MPLIDTYQKPSKTSRFEKKAYRPWDDLDQNSSVVSESSEHQILPKETEGKSEEKRLAVPDDNEKVQTKTLVAVQTKKFFKPEITETSSFESVSFSVRGLRTIQRQLVFFIVDLCIERRQLSSGPITQEMLLDLCNTNINIIKKRNTKTY